MRFLLDACVPVQLAAALNEFGFDAISAVSQEGLTDAQILEQSHIGNRVLVTLDKDFGELVVREEQAALGVILVRVPVATREQVNAVAARIANLGQSVRSTITILSVEGVRQRPLKPVG
ncbi:MAG TPA: DUF5615 family PIN-like protein [Micropepsaceae bacterium]|nr:DUF5615 family PIN-like protein [Micropepsaceae bacterium]